MSNCACTVDQIEQFCGGVNAPGLDRELAITCQDELLAIPAPGVGTHTIATDITYRAADVGPPEITAGKFYRWGFAKKDAKFVSKRNENGLWETQVNIFIQQLTSEKTFVFNGLTGENLVVVVPDRNGRKRVVGSLTDGCMVEVEETTDPQNGYNIIIKWESAHAPYYYTGALTY